MTRQELQRVREWADMQIAAGEDPAWVWYQYMKLREALDGIIASMECAALQSESLLPMRQAEIGPHLVVSNDRPAPAPKPVGAVETLPRKFGV
jgi:hypothetical protein